MKRISAVTSTLLAAALLAGCSSSANDQTAQTPESSTTAPATTSTSAAPDKDQRVTTREFKLEDLAVTKDISLPVRGYITAVAGSDSPLIILNHLRSFNCDDDTFAYPCPKGTKPVRLDEGMHYAAEGLAKAGYTVVVPDLGPLWAPDELDKPYDQTKAWLDMMEEIRAALAEANKGMSTPLGKGLKESTDLTRTGVFMHSRSAIVGNAAAKAWPGVSLASYGGFYILPETDEDSFAPAPADVPLLTIDGLADRDVDRAAASWLPEYVGQDRTQPALSAIVPGLGHNFINHVLSAKGFDDRVDDSLATPEEHERFLVEVLTQWFDQTIKGKKGPLPLRATDPLPQKVGGLDARMFALTPNSQGTHPARWIAATDGEKLQGLNATYCRGYSVMNPIDYDDRCDLPKQGVVNSRSVVARFTLNQSPAFVPVSSPDAAEVAIHVMPTGSRKDDKKETPLQVFVVFADGSEQIEVPVPSMNPALKDRKAKNYNGEYWIETLRLPLPEKARGKEISGIALTGDGSVDLRAVELF